MPLCCSSTISFFPRDCHVWYLAETEAVYGYLYACTDYICTSGLAKSGTIAILMYQNRL